LAAHAVEHRLLKVAGDILEHKQIGAVPAMLFQWRPLRCRGTLTMRVGSCRRASARVQWYTLFVASTVRTVHRHDDAVLLCGSVGERDSTHIGVVASAPVRGDARNCSRHPRS